eukprot:gene2518-3224_t
MKTKWIISSNQCIFTDSNDILSTINYLNTFPFKYKKLPLNVNLETIFSFLNSFWASKNNRSCCSIDFKFDKDNQKILQGIHFQFLFCNLDIDEEKAFSVLTEISSRFVQILNFFFNQNEKKKIIENIQAILSLEIEKFKDKKNHKFLQQFLRLDEQKFQILLKYFEDSYDLTNDLKELQNQLYYITFQFILKKINNFFDVPSKKDIKILSIIEIIELNSIDYMNQNWDDFFVNYACEFIKMKIFNQFEENEKMNEFISLINEKYDLFSIHSTNNFVKDKKSIQESLQKLYTNASILDSSGTENSFIVHYPFSKKSINYKLSLIEDLKPIWNFIDHFPDIKYHNYLYRRQNDLNTLKDMIVGDEFNMISSLKPSLNLKNQLLNLGIQHLKSINFSTFDRQHQLEKATESLAKMNIKNESNLWFYEYIQKIENIKKEDENYIFSLTLIKNFLPFSREIILEEIKLTKLYLNINIGTQVFFPLTKLLNSNLVVKIIFSIKEIFKNSTNSWLFLIKFGFLDSFTILLQNYLLSLEYEENQYFLFEDDEKEKKKYHRNCENHYSVIIEIIEFFELISEKFAERNKKTPVFDLWLKNSGQMMFISTIKLITTSTERINKNQARYLNEILIMKVIKIFLNFANTVSSLFQMYDQELSMALSKNFSKLKKCDDLQISIMELTFTLYSKRLILDYFIKHGLILEIIKNIEYCSLSVLESSVKVIIALTKRQKLCKDYVVYFAFFFSLRFYEYVDSDEESYYSSNNDEDFDIIELMKLLWLVYQSGTLDSNPGYQTSRNCENSFLAIFHRTLMEEVRFDHNIIESIQNLEIKDENFEKKMKLISGIYLFGISININ